MGHEQTAIFTGTVLVRICKLEVWDLEKIQTLPFQKEEYIYIYIYTSELYEVAC